MRTFACFQQTHTRSAVCGISVWLVVCCVFSTSSNDNYTKTFFREHGKNRNAKEKNPYPPKGETCVAHKSSQRWQQLRKYFLQRFVSRNIYKQQTKCGLLHFSIAFSLLAPHILTNQIDLCGSSEKHSWLRKMHISLYMAAMDITTRSNSSVGCFKAI